MNDYTLEQLGYAFLGSFAGAFYLLCELSDTCDYIYPRAASVHAENDELFVDVAIAVHTKQGTVHLKRSLHSSREELIAGLTAFDVPVGPMQKLVFVELQGIMLAKEVFAKAQDIYKNLKPDNSNVIPIH